MDVTSFYRNKSNDAMYLITYVYLIRYKKKLRVPLRAAPFLCGEAPSAARQPLVQPVISGAGRAKGGGGGGER